MRLFRTLFVGGTAVALGATVALSLAEARAALIADLHKPDVALFPQRAPEVHTGSNVPDTSTYNWAGYADTSSTTGEFTKVSGDWTVPSVTCTYEDRITSEWVGLDGFSSDTVEQDGTVSQCFQDKAVYYSWYEMYPAGTVEVGNTVAAGDGISASVSRSGANYTLTLTDSTHTANSFTETATCATSTCLDTSAEWIAERPAYSIGIVPEAQFSPVTFTSNSAVAGGQTVNISTGPSPFAITSVDATDTYDIVSTSGLTHGNFTSTWRNSY